MAAPGGGARLNQTLARIGVLLGRPSFSLEDWARFSARKGETTTRPFRLFSESPADLFGLRRTRRWNYFPSLRALTANALANIWMTTNADY